MICLILFLQELIREAASRACPRITYIDITIVLDRRLQQPQVSLQNIDQIFGYDEFRSGLGPL